jgi:hypothetical protein
MPPVEWIDIGYQGFGWPQWELIKALVLDYRYGLFLFTSASLGLLVLVSPLSNRKGPHRVPSLVLNRLPPTGHLSVLGLLHHRVLVPGHVS